MSGRGFNFFNLLRAISGFPGDLRRQRQGVRDA